MFNRHQLESYELHADFIPVSLLALITVLLNYINPVMTRYLSLFVRVGHHLLYIICQFTNIITYEHLPKVIVDGLSVFDLIVKQGIPR